jgi:RimJ/RimL family protein N-acetyltransferase
VISLRPATHADADLLLDWANDPTTRAAGFHPEPIDQSTHELWLSARLASPTSRLYVGLEDERPIGQVRLEVGTGGRTEVGISIASEARGRGLGGALLRAALAAGRSDRALGVDTFTARIRPENVASISLFSEVGFLLVGTEQVGSEDALVYELPAA